MPLATYATLAGAFNAGMAGVLLMSRRRERSWKRRMLRRLGMPGGAPDHMSPSEVALLGVASFRVARLVSKAKVASFIRAPFTEFQGEGDAPGEVNESARGTGLQRGIGELLTCPYCLSVWAAGGLLALRQVEPYSGRLITRLFSAVAVADAMQEAYILLDAYRRDAP